MSRTPPREYLTPGDKGMFMTELKTPGRTQKLEDIEILKQQLFEQLIETVDSRIRDSFIN